MANKVKVTINQAGLSKEIKSQIHLARGLNKEVEVEGRKNFEKIKRDFISEFLTHPVTKAVGGSGSSFGLVSYGDLRSFIGFTPGENPISPIENILEARLFVKYVDFNRRGIARFFINVPSEEEIVEASPMPWAGGISWAKGIENGIPNFGKYLNRQGLTSSRSGQGVQVKNDIRKSKFTPKPYVFKMLKKYLRIFNKSGFLLN